MFDMYLGKTIPDDEYWFTDTGSRRKSEKNAGFQQLLLLIKEDKIGTVYIESQNRWGTRYKELFTHLGLLNHRTKLFDLRARTDLTNFVYRSN